MSCICGAIDCPDCHPELCEESACIICGELHPLYNLWDYEVCNKCHKLYAYCPACFEWVLEKDMINGICKKCKKEQEEY